MLIQKQVKTTRNTILIILIILSLGGTGYLIYKNSHQDSSSKGLMIEDAVMQVSIATAQNAGWESVALDRILIDGARVLALKRLAEPLDIPSIIKGKTNVFQAFDY
ncbi:MAG: hypothetical protein WC480_03585 [Patescibacteria group bacterium]